MTGVQTCALPIYTNDERIGKVVLGSINNTTTGTAGYENFTSQSTDLGIGTANTITITPTWTGTIYNEGYGVWIDYNKNGFFTDAGEMVVAKSASKITPVSASFTVPAGATLGTTRMRVSMKYNAIPTSCESFTYGQVEDYTVNIIAGVPISSIAVIDGEGSNVLEFNLFPNPVDGILNISVSNNANATYKIYNLVGQEVKSGNTNQKEISLANLQSGMYIFEVNDGQKTVIKKFIKR